MMWEAEFVGGPHDGSVFTFQGDRPPSFLNVEVYPPVDWATDSVPPRVLVRYRLEVSMDPERPAWRLVLEP